MEKKEEPAKETRSEEKKVEENKDEDGTMKEDKHDGDKKQHDNTDTITEQCNGGIYNCEAFVTEVSQGPTIKH